MSNPAFIVDGFTEKQIIQILCPNTPIRRTNLNGTNVELDAIAKRIATIINTFNNRHYPIIILIDREGRNDTVHQIQAKLLDLINSLIDNEELIIGVADRMIENWILADWENFRTCSGITGQPSVTNFEGKRGKSAIRSLYPHYKETRDGVQFFISGNPQQIVNNSNSFKVFAQELMSLNCPWFDGLMID